MVTDEREKDFLTLIREARQRLANKGVRLGSQVLKEIREERDGTTLEEAIDLLIKERDELAAQVSWYRHAMAYEARCVEAHYEGYKTFPKSRRPFAENQVVRMRAAARVPFNGYSEISRTSFESELRAMERGSR